MLGLKDPQRDWLDHAHNHEARDQRIWKISLLDMLKELKALVPTSRAGASTDYGDFQACKTGRRAPKIPPPPKREDPAKDSICHECGETGHWKRNCPQYLAELLKKKKNTASGAGGGSGIFVIELNTFLNRSWIYDTGCGTHICNTTQGLRASRKLKPGALSLYVGNGQREAVEAIGNFDLSLPSGLVIVLNNYHYAPSITRGSNFTSRVFGSSQGSWDYRPSYSSLHSTTQWCVEEEKQNPTRYGSIYDGQTTFQEFLFGIMLLKTALHASHTMVPTSEGDLGEPANYKAALLDPESDKWLTAMNVEMQSMKDKKCGSGFLQLPLMPKRWLQVALQEED
ncbi:zinc finger, CCHC-type containing protein [Tanacetum coccineum]|uniref:Zinc finger, CCHC-type containing protein n=1 Tax=Tanacetum coccineum TaxID=301880 RepID=A0ABQ5EH65_9ASTR